MGSKDTLGILVRRGSMKMSERGLNMCKKCNSIHEGNGNVCGICQDNIIEKLEGLLGAALCPCCDGSGGYYDNHGQPTQCQWCYEKKEILHQSDKKGDSSGQ